MHPNKHFRVIERAKLMDFVKERGFGTLVAATGDGLKGASIPFVVDEASLRFHLVGSNELVRTLERSCDVFLTVNGPDAYISPDWYEAENQVPTWNYVAVHVQGTCKRLPDEVLPHLLDDLSAEHEARLAPKAQWTSAKMDAQVYARMRRAIVPYEIEITSIEGTWKLGQNKQDVDFNGAIAGLDGRGDAASLAVAALMKAAKL